MASLGSIVKIINDSLKTKSFSDKRFQKVAAFGISKSLPYKKNDVFEFIPTEIDDNGEAKVLFPDDKNPIQFYHKVNSIAYSLQKEQHGNGNDSIVRVAQMSLVVFAQRNKIKLSEEVLDLYIAKGLPSKLTVVQKQELKLNDCTITQVTTDFNSVQLFAREYNTKQYYLKPEHLFFEVKYQIECKLNKSCINTCETC